MNTHTLSNAVLQHFLRVILTLAVVAEMDFDISPDLIENLKHILITFGEEATPHSAPFVVFLEISRARGVVLCGGALISHNYVLTAGHCVRKASAIDVYLGAHNRTFDYGTIIPAENWKAHSDPRLNDIAVIKLKNNVNFTDHIQPAILPSRSDADQDYVGQIGRIYGWGITENRTESDVLLYADMPIIQNKICVQPETYICAAKINKSGTCSGDSGGPLVVESITVGLVHGSLCASHNLDYPSVFSRVSKYLDWIEENTDVLIN